jgi:Host cell surface-exposed lipoprotein
MERDFRPNVNEQAAKAAKDYLDSSSFSRSGLIEQLEYEGYTKQQAVYGVNQAGL